jgi:hypothetical protein
MEMKRIHINLPKDVHDALKSMCKTQCRSISSQIQFLIRNADDTRSGDSDDPSISILKLPR